jgi:hypothetical protein
MNTWSPAPVYANVLAFTVSNGEESLMLSRVLANFVAAAVLFMATGAYAGEPVKSGPQVGQEVPGPFHPMNITGEQAGKKACLYCANGSSPVAVVFARSVNPQVATLLKKLDDATVMNSKANMGSFAVFCSDQESLDGTLRNLAGKQGLKKLVLSIDNPAGPKGYEIAKDADVTVLLYSDFTVRANYAFKTGELSQKGIDGIVADVSKIVPAK